MPRKLLLILNPQAGHRESKLRLFELVDLFSSQNCIVTVLPTRQKSDATRFVQQQAALFDTLLCCGGDGTLNEVVTGLMSMEEQPELGYIPAGTTNDMANSLNLPRRLLKAAAVILKRQVREHDIGTFHDGYFVYAAAFGAFTEVSYLTPQHAKIALGPIAYVLEGIRRLPDIRAHHMIVEHDGERIEGDFIFGAVTNTLSIAGIRNPMPGEVRLDDGRFEVLLVRNPTTTRQLRKTLADLSRRRYDNENVLFFQTDKVVFLPDHPVPWTVDGEDGGLRGKTEIVNIPRRIRFLAGDRRKADASPRDPASE